MTLRSPPAKSVCIGDQPSSARSLDASIAYRLSCPGLSCTFSPVLMWWKRTSCFRAASSSRIVPSTFVRMNGSGLAMELSLCDSAAKWTMAS